MFRIKITKEILNYANEYASELFADKNNGSVGPKFIKPKEQNRDDGLNMLKNGMSCESNSLFISKAQKYIDEIWDSYEALLVSRENGGRKKFHYWKKKFEKILSQDELKTEVKYKNNNKEFYKHLVDVLKYDEAKKYIYKYFPKMGIKSCVYCNFKKVEVRSDNSADFQLDHYWCRSRYPYLCTSFFNLFPCCGACNITKLAEDYSGFFNLFCEEKELQKLSQEQDPFLFRFPDAVLKYYQNRNCDDATIFFESRTGYGSEFLKNSKIQKLYNGINHIAKERLEEILYNLEDRTETQITVDQNTFNLPYLASDRYRAVFGKYYKIEDTHKADLTKMSVDFGKENHILK